MEKSHGSPNTASRNRKTAPDNSIVGSSTSRHSRLLYEEERKRWFLVIDRTPMEGREGNNGEQQQK